MARTAILHASRRTKAAHPAKPRSIDEARDFWADAFAGVRGETESRAAHLSAEDQIVQSMADCSPAKWHRAHVTWFFEQFLLVPNDPGYKIFDERFPFLFNSYYVAAGPRHARPQRGLITRPNGADVAGYRAHVDAAVAKLIANVAADKAEQVFSILEIGLNHEQQHQELLVTDI
ncbi:MAG: DinB family protein, partial [Pseudolabrys sp.]